MIYYIGIHGPKRVGKDMFAGNLSRFVGTTDRDLGDRFAIDRMADPLYAWASEITGWTPGRLMGHEKDTPFTEESVQNKSLIGRTPRSLILDQGMFVRGQYGMDFMNNCLEMRSRRTHVKYMGNLWVFVPDVRTEAEVKLMHIVYELSRDGCTYEGGVTEHALDGIELTHVHLKTCGDVSHACDFLSVYSHLLNRLKDMR